MHPNFPTPPDNHTAFVSAKLAAVMDQPRSNYMRLSTLEPRNHEMYGFRHIRITSHVLSYWNISRLIPSNCKAAWVPFTSRRDSDIRRMQGYITRDRNEFWPQPRQWAVAVRNLACMNERPIYHVTRILRKLYDGSPGLRKS